MARIKQVGNSLCWMEILKNVDFQFEVRWLSRKLKHTHSTISKGVNFLESKGIVIKDNGRFRLTNKGIEVKENVHRLDSFFDGELMRIERG